MLLDEDPRRQCLLRIVVTHRHRALHNDGTRVEIGRDEVHGDSAHFDTVLERLLRRVKSRKRWEKGGVDVEHRVGKGVNERRADFPHETCETYERDVPLTQLAHQRAIVVGSRRPPAMTHGQRLDPYETRALEPAGVLLVGNDDCNGGVEPALGDGIKDRLQIAAAAGDEHAEPSVGGTHQTYVTDGGSPATISPITRASLPPRAANSSISASACSFAETMISPMPMLNVRIMSSNGTRPLS